MDWRKAELKQFGDEIVWLNSNISKRKFEKLNSYFQKDICKLDAKNFASFDRLNIKEQNDSQVDDWLKNKTATSTEKVEIYFAADLAFVTSLDFFLYQWRGLFCPGRDDVLITNANFEWLLFYYHEDEYEFGYLPDISKDQLSKNSVLLNQQTKIIINTSNFVIFIHNILKAINLNKYLSVVFVNDSRIKELNSQYRNKNYSTDVLSFPNEADEFDSDDKYLGDVIISAEQAQRQATENNLSLDLEIKQLILHGILHLCGYDHETDNGEMNELELELREKLEIC